MDRRQFLGAGVCLGATALERLGSAPPILAASQAASVPAAEQPVWLSWNENPWGMAPGAKAAALSALERGHRYPDAERDALAEQIAVQHGLQRDNVVLGAGSTQLLQAAALHVVPITATVVMAEPTFGAIRHYGRALSVRIEQVPLDGRWAHDLEQMRERVGDRPALVYLCNPNNPTATLTPSADIDRWIGQAAEDTLFVVDEAYFEYVQAPGYHSCARWVAERPNVIVTRTFSKIFAMAGMRLGYALSHSSTAQRLRALVSLDNVSGPSVAAGRASLDDQELVPRSRRANESARAIAVRCLDELELAHLPSHANFLMHEIRGDLGAFIERMQDRGIRVGRPFPPMSSYNRLSIGRPEEMELWAAAMRDFRQRAWI